MTAVVMSWSGGKDACMALSALQQTPGTTVAGLLTSVTRDSERISMHGVRRDLLVRQATALGLPLRELALPAFPSNAVYEAALGEALAEYRRAGVETVAFGDLFLEDIRAYRDALMARLGMTAIYPVWGRATRGFLEAFIAQGFKAVAVCVDLAKLDLSFAGRAVDVAFLADLPDGVDPAGENGEFHTFVFDGPNFRQPVDFTLGGREARDGFGFVDLIPAA
ncbi:adenine nucleotide alpha hydrolase [Phenylobacterium sp.]|uniref:adenine nucleotide alpha hydrolase n=1 Tax=Phenylobacterium sp. TaxID=1871053 RepID=UPI00122689FC|nr:adenine nucleotide alpha hydrolase [Phenylobacterium sp.]THD58098.1 MAG: adenine nucleotide alpha hydrolase [Phenylobacterium sp.]